MPGSKAILGRVKDSLPLKETEANIFLNTSTTPLRINFDDNRWALMDVSNPRGVIWSKMISRMQRRNQPAYVEVDADTNTIARLCIPITTTVLEINEAGNGPLEVALSASDALHVLHRNTPGFDDLYHVLQHAKNTGASIMVTATMHHFDIIDARALPTGFGIKGPYDPLPDPEPIIPVSHERCVELFNLVAATTCETGSMESPCIPFKYPGSGCDVRAHLMCYMMRAAGATPEKMWLAPGLKAKTSNAPLCEVGWRFHVAPTLTVTQPDGTTEKMIIDPSLCDGPVKVEYWKSLQGNPEAALLSTQWEGYNFPGNGTATLEEANEEMDDYRERLADLWIESPRPYKCPREGQ